MPVRMRSPKVSRGWDARDHPAPPGARRSPSAPSAAGPGEVWALGLGEPPARQSP